MGISGNHQKQEGFENLSSWYHWSEHRTQPRVTSFNYHLNCSPQRAEPSAGRSWWLTFRAWKEQHRAKGRGLRVIGSICQDRHARQRSQAFHENEPLTLEDVAWANEIISSPKGRHSQGGPETRQGSFQEQLRDTAWLEMPLVTRSSEAKMWLSGGLG